MLFSTQHKYVACLCSILSCDATLLQTVTSAINTNITSFCVKTMDDILSKLFLHYGL